jgi:hypothetical protein
MNLNSKGKLAKFYMWLPPEDKQLPQDLCTFFWGLVARAFAIFIVGGLVLAAILVCAAQVGIFLWAHKDGALFVVALVAFSVFIVWLSERKKKFELFSEARKVVKAKVDGVKGRYCPRIEWK